MTIEPFDLPHARTSRVRRPTGTISGGRGRKNGKGSRSDNATVRLAESVLTMLEGGDAGLIFASGMAAATTALLALERPAHVVASTAMYWGLRQGLAEDAPSHGLAVTFFR